MITLSIPEHSGYRKDFHTTEEAMEAAAAFFRIDVDDIVCVQCNGDDDRFYLYESQEEADKDQDGAYAVQIFGQETAA